ncbi:DUF1876 domain-containing protein [Mycobacterium heckeshornense]|uniref:Uncharacterized protein n=1 Tax=Mycobacterium heckeshornense TaxID=110505 RepID=A0A2G8B689_9MYCO|nr:DUF1876 domain-containing protein [Mycobacterium heckeshornense]KMV20914.1 hypothetical protein ACT16_19395 [Mycobacterium heckeshornense]MCV7034944.1 DUF1876 domain-containing protein [Mycobacterium heckeshornense]PIJ33237.1 DUF1876 domain-containing protein [Mycobacterium heckeshornense]BCO34974.1 hypothetical protein MHEC_14070 [Mycobacterium heckeshornense]
MTPASGSSKTFDVSILVDEHEERTRARARLRWRGEELVGVGLARLSPDDEPVAEIGDELAIARALNHLAKQLLVTTESDIEVSTNKPVTNLHL